MREKQNAYGREEMGSLTWLNPDVARVTLRWGEGSKKTTGFYVLASVAFTELATWIIYWFK